MLAYAASRPAAVQRRPHPNTMLAIVAVHVAVIAAVMSAKMDIIRHRPPPPTIVDTIPLPKTPDPNPTTRRPTTPLPMPLPQNPLGPQPLPLGPTFPTGPSAGAGSLGGGGAVVIPEIIRPVLHFPVKLDALLATPASELKPPYPASKLLSEEEAVLRLRLTIDEHGRVVAVEPVGGADRAFLEAARRHLIAHWRYRPASEDGRAIGSTQVITLRFQLDG